jgi:hypothetical protein
MSSGTLVTVIHGIVALAIIAASTVLLALHDIDSTTAMALYTAGLGVVGGAASTALALKVPTGSGSGS